jgi:hypothetical protein
MFGFLAEEKGVGGLLPLFMTHLVNLFEFPADKLHGINTTTKILNKMYSEPKTDHREVSFRFPCDRRARQLRLSV